MLFEKQAEGNDKITHKDQRHVSINVDRPTSNKEWQPSVHGGLHTEPAKDTNRRNLQKCYLGISWFSKCDQGSPTKTICGPRGEFQNRTQRSESQNAAGRRKRPTPPASDSFVRPLAFASLTSASWTFLSASWTSFFALSTFLSAFSTSFFASWTSSLASCLQDDDSGYSPERVLSPSGDVSASVDVDASLQSAWQSLQDRGPQQIWEDGFWSLSTCRWAVSTCRWALACCCRARSRSCPARLTRRAAVRSDGRPLPRPLGLPRQTCSTENVTKALVNLTCW